MRRRLEDRIRDLCAQAIAADGGPELDVIIPELRRAIHEHIERLRKKAAEKLLIRENGDSPDRRSAG